MAKAYSEKINENNDVIGKEIWDIVHKICQWY